MAEVLLLPFPPSVNNLFAQIGRRRVMSKRGRIYRSAVVAICGPRKPLTGEVHVKIDVYPPDRRRRDIDNLSKAVLDGLKAGGVYEDDSQVGHLDILRCAVSKPGRVVVQVEEYEP